jgi:hypothetical protein
MKNDSSRNENTSLVRREATVVTAVNASTRLLTLSAFDSPPVGQSLKRLAQLTQEHIETESERYIVHLNTMRRNVSASLLQPIEVLAVICPRTGRIRYVSAIVVSGKSHSTAIRAVESAGREIQSLQPGNESTRIITLLEGLKNLLTAKYKRASIEDRKNVSWYSGFTTLRKRLGHKSGSKTRSYLSKDQRRYVFDKAHGDISQLLRDYPKLVVIESKNRNLQVEVIDGGNKKGWKIRARFRNTPDIK